MSTLQLVEPGGEIRTDDIRLEAFPRPRRDTGLGFHYFPDSRHFSAADAALWIPRMRRLHASWVTLRTTPDQMIPAAFLEALIGAEMEPVVVIAPVPGEGMPTPAIARHAGHYAAAGVHYVSLLHEPNVEANWSRAAWHQPRLVPRLMASLLPALERLVDAGLHPLLPALRPGGDYWDTAFLASMFEEIARDGSAELMARLGVAIQNFAYNRPLSWGEGGQSRWADALPYHGGRQDHRGWRLWEWYDEIARHRLGRPIPMISTAGGALVHSRAQPDLPALGGQLHAEHNLAIVERVQNGAVPAFLFNQSFWLLAAEPGDSAYEEAWFKPDGGMLPAVTALEERPRVTRRASDARRVAAARRLQRAPARIGHYLLMPSWSWGVSSLHWDAVRPFVQSLRPTIGFSVEEASLAARVTVPVGAQGYDDGILYQLRRAGCEVDTVDAADFVTLQREFARRATQSPRPAAEVEVSRAAS